MGNRSHYSSCDWSAVKKVLDIGLFSFWEFELFFSRKRPWAFENTDYFISLLLSNRPWQLRIRHYMWTQHKYAYGNRVRSDLFSALRRQLCGKASRPYISKLLKLSQPRNGPSACETSAFFLKPQWVSSPLFSAVRSGLCVKADILYYVIYILIY